MYGLTEKELNILKEIFLKYKGIEKVLVYGSRAKGTYKRGSDIDLVLIGSNNLKEKIFYIYDELEENLPYFIDISLYNSIQNKKLKEHIDRFGKIIFQRI